MASTLACPTTGRSSNPKGEIRTAASQCKVLYSLSQFTRPTGSGMKVAYDDRKARSSALQQAFQKTRDITYLATSRLFLPGNLEASASLKHQNFTLGQTLKPCEVAGDSNKCRYVRMHVDYRMNTVNFTGLPQRASQCQNTIPLERIREKRGVRQV